MHIRFELRQSQKQYLQEAPPFHAPESDSPSLEVKVAVAQVCRGCEYRTECKPSIHMRSSGVTRKSSSIIEGNKISGEHCRSLLDGISISRRKPKKPSTNPGTFTSKVGNKYFIKVW